jgi:hypothetical protein
MSPVAPEYASYKQVPWYRRQWFFWLMWLLFSPIGIGILITGEVYYVKKGVVQRFGIANRVVAGLIALLWLSGVIRAVTGG